MNDSARTDSSDASAVHPTCPESPPNAQAPEGGGSQESNDLDRLQEDLDRAQAELETLKDRHLRLQADFDNFRKRTMRERAEMQARALEEMMRLIIPVLDHFDAGLKSASEHRVERGVIEGFELVRSEFLRALERCGLVPVDAAPGQPFDPLQHEAVAHEPSVEIAADAVVRQVRRGYRLGTHLLRPAQVVVSSGPTAGSLAGESGDAR